MPQRPLEGMLAISWCDRSGAKSAWKAVFHPDVTHRERERITSSKGSCILADCGWNTTCVYERLNFYYFLYYLYGFICLWVRLYVSLRQLVSMGFTEITVQDTILRFYSRVMTGSVELSGMESTMRLFVCNVEIKTAREGLPLWGNQHLKTICIWTKS